MERVYRILARTILATGLITASAAQAQEAPALAAATGAEKARLQELLKDAAKEGQLSYWDTIIDPEASDALVAAFHQRYGLPQDFKVQFTQASSGDLVKLRVDQELSAKRITIDVAGASAPAWALEHAQHGDFLAYDSPESAAYSAATARGLAIKSYVALPAITLFQPAWNTEELPFKGSSLQDIIGAVPPGRISAGDSTVSVAALSLFIGYRMVLPLEYFEKLAAMKPQFVTRGENMLSRIVTGEDLMAFQMTPGRVWQVNQKGATLKVLFPREGVVPLPQNTFITSGAPHPAAAKLWIDFILSEAGQKILVSHGIGLSGRDHFESPLPEYEPSLDKLTVIPVDWTKVTVADMDKARAEWVSIFKK